MGTAGPLAGGEEGAVRWYVIWPSAVQLKLATGSGAARWAFPSGRRTT
jgi:hypothetical protein